MNGNYQAGLAVPQMHGNDDNAATSDFSTNKNGDPRAAVGVLMKKPFLGAKSVPLCKT